MDNLYETALARQNIVNDPYNREVSSNPFEAADNSQSGAQMAAMAHYHEYGVFMQQQIANMSQSQQPLIGQHEALMMQQQMAIVSLQHQTAAGEIQEEEAQNQENMPQLQLEGPAALVNNEKNPFGNPFTDQDVTTYNNLSQDHFHVSENQNSQSSLI